MTSPEDKRRAHEDKPSSDADQSSQTSEEWPDPDIDPYTEEGKRAYRKAREALYNHVQREVMKRERPFRGPDKAYEILNDLYDKAEKANDELTEKERALLLSQGDVVGKALAQPEKLTEEERYQILQWSPPTELHAAIRKATGDDLSTPETMYARWCDGGLQQFTPEGRRILKNKFWIDAATGASETRLRWNEPPGNMQAQRLLYARAGVDIMFLVKAEMRSLMAPDPANTVWGMVGPIPKMTLSASARRYMKEALDSMPPPPGKTSPPASEDEDLGGEDRRPRKRTRTTFDSAGKPDWPNWHPPHLADPPRLFWHDKLKAEFPGQMFDDVESEAMKRRQGLRETERASYAAQSEDLRSQAWDEVEAISEKLSRGESTPGMKQFKLPGMDEFIEWQLRELQKKNTRGPPPPPRRERSRNVLDNNGQSQWPPHVSVGRFTASSLWLDEQKSQHPGQRLQDIWKVHHDFVAEVQRRFNDMDEEKKAPYKARSEQLRQETWDATARRGRPH